jgi:hypothetical protein
MKMFVQKFLLPFVTPLFLAVLSGLPLMAQNIQWTSTSCLSVNQTGYCVAAYPGGRYVIAEARSHPGALPVLQVVKLGSGGTTQGSITYNYGGQGCIPVRIHADAAGNIYVFMTATRLTNGLPNINAVLVKFDSTLTMVWNRAVDSGGINPDEAVDMLAEPNGNILILTNLKVNTTNPDINLRRYTPAGAFITNRNYGAVAQTEAASRMRLDASGNVVVCGFVGTGTENFGLLVCFSPTSFNLLWNESYNHSAGTDDRFNDLVIGSGGFIYCGGFTRIAGSTTNTTDALLVRYNATGIFQSVRTNNKLKNDYFSHLGTDAAGNVYAAQFSYVDFLSGSVLNGDARFSLMKWTNTLGTLLVNNAFNYTAFAGSIRGFAVTPGGKAMLVGQIGVSGRPGLGQYIAIKYTASGTRDFIDTVSVNPNARTSAARGLLLVSNGAFPNDEFVVVGSRRDSGGLDCRLVRKYTGPAPRIADAGEDEDMPHVYPNPVSDFCRIEGLDEPSNLIIYTIEGRESARFTYIPGELLDLHALPPGLYLLTFPDQPSLRAVRLLRQ